MKRLPQKYEVRGGGRTLLFYRARYHGEYGIVTVKGDREYFYPWNSVCQDFYGGPFYQFDPNDNEPSDIRI